VVNQFDWTAGDQTETDDAIRRYDEQSEALAVALMVDREAIILLSAFEEYSSDHERIASCRRAFRSAARFVRGAKVRTILVRDSASTPAAVLGYIDAPPSDDEFREAMNRLMF
jgi:hypothetical protein